MTAVRKYLLGERKLDSIGLLSLTESNILVQ